MGFTEPPQEETRLSPLALSESYRTQPRLTWTDATGNHEQTIEGRILVGSSPEVALVVQDPTVSRLHAELEAKEDGLWVRDLGSRNGTFVGGLRVTGACVPDKGRIRLANIEIVVDYNASQVRSVELWPETRFGKMVGASVRMRELFATLARIAPMDASILIMGETGTGKELVARALHDASSRANKPFVVVDCAALPDTLLDAELFGHSKGAFTGAVGARLGAIETAHGGTVFLDEIGELPMSMQPKLLRVLESRTVRRVGEADYRDVDVRFISATHRDLLTMVNAGEFREDLYFRLSVLPIRVPALRERVEDIELLVRHFLQTTAPVDAQVVRELAGRPWRGNVRELRNFVDRVRALGPAEALALTGLAGGVGEANLPSVAPTAPFALPQPPSPQPALTDAGLFEQAYKDFRETWVDMGEKEYVRRLLLRHDRNVSAAAREAEVDRTYIYRLIRKHEL